MGLFVFLLAALGAWVGLTRGEDGGDCAFTFSVSADQMDSFCRRGEDGPMAQELRQNTQELVQENKQLRKDLEALAGEYKGMVDTVKQLETETASWRQVFTWPVLDYALRPDNTTITVYEGESFADCTAAFKAGHKKAGIYLLEPEGIQNPFFAFCEDGWTVFHRRFDGNVDFYKYWDEYMSGFGELSGEFWLGLEHIHVLSAREPSYLYVESQGYNNKFYFALHEDFEVGDETTNYVLQVGNQTEGNYLDVMSELNEVRFSTRDVDNDEWGNNNCANYYQGGWWLKNCGFDPNRRYCQSASCMAWGERPVQKIVMKVRAMSEGPPDRKSAKKQRKAAAAKRAKKLKKQIGK